MSQADKDMWSEWLLQRRFGGNKQALQDALSTFLYPVRDKVLKHAALDGGETLLDVGSGDGLIAFGALEHVPASHVIFSDISHDLLNHCQALAARMSLLSRCQFVQASADDLTTIRDASVEAVTTRSVLIYVEAKQRALHEFYRVLKPGGRLSIFEPINRFGFPAPPHLFLGYDVSPVQELADKLKAVFGRIQPEHDPMLDFDERDLLNMVEQAGFREIHLDLHIEVKSPPERMNWETVFHTAANPKAPTLEEAMQQALTPDETTRFIAHLRPLVETRQGIQRSALAYLWAVK